MVNSRISVAPAICRSSMIFEAAFLRTNDCTATARDIIKAREEEESL